MSRLNHSKNAMVHINNMYTKIIITDNEDYQLKDTLFHGFS